MTVVNNHQPTMHDDLEAIDWSESDRRHEMLEKGRGRIENRRCTVADLGDPEWDGACCLSGRRQAVRIERRTDALKTGEISEEPAMPCPRPTGSMPVPGVCWHSYSCAGIGAMHYARESTCGEDRCRVHAGRTPCNPTCPGTIAILLARLAPRFGQVPQTNRCFATASRRLSTPS